MYILGMYIIMSYMYIHVYTRISSIYMNTQYTIYTIHEIIY